MVANLSIKTVDITSEPCCIVTRDFMIRASYPVVESDLKNNLESNTEWCNRNVPPFEIFCPSAAWQLVLPMHSTSANFGKLKLN